MGLVASFMVLFGTRGMAIGSEVLGDAAVLVVIGLWLGTGAFRHDPAGLRLRSALWLLPIAAIHSGWLAIPGTGAALLVEGICVAMLFAATLESLGAEFGSELRRRVRPGLRPGA